MSIPQSRETAPAPTKRLTADGLRWLVCPVCHGALTLQEINPEIHKITCIACFRTYPIVDNLPVLLADSATLST